ncbi:MAG: bifunctional 2-dehydro-3-deoxygluconokinase/2-dehydro-3-deoxygalactonokinase [Haloferacaceae archaeon]
MTDLVTFGETMLRLSPPSGRRLSRTENLDVHVGGAESNVAVAASNLGLDAAWLSLLPRTPLGERVVHALRGEGVEPVVTWTETGRVGTYYVERGVKPRASTVVYDRADAPIRAATPDDLPLARVRAAAAFHTSGIAAALSDRAARTTAELLRTAREAGVRTSFDVNYRAKLWDADDARATLVDLLDDVDVLFVAERDARDVFGHEGAPEAVARAFERRHGFETVVLTRGDEGALAVHEGTVHEQPALEVDTVDPIGSGDAFVGGYLAARFDGETVPTSLARGAATAGLKRTVEGDAAVVSPADVAAVLADEGSTRER